MEIAFSEDYPVAAPIVKFVPILWHMNVWSSGRVCLNILNPEDGTWHGKWSPSVTIKQILLAVQDLLDNPYPAGARPEVQTMWKDDRKAYDKRLKEEADKYKTE
jgi:ubiquitin-conjugating enzyme E2 I